MTAVASVAALTPSPAVAVDEPVVFVDGLPQLEMPVVDYHAAGPLDMREVACLLPPSISQASRDRLFAHEAYVAQPHALGDGEVRWEVLAYGRLVQSDRQRTATAARRGVALVDDWSARLVRPIDNLWAMVQTEPTRSQAVALRVGAEANRSTHRYGVQGKEVYLPEAVGRGEAWTLTQALETLAAMAGVDLILGRLPSEIAERRLLAAVDFSKTVGEALSAILEPLGLVIRRELLLEGTGVRGVQAVVPGDSGRPIALPWPDAQGRGGRVLSTTIEQTITPPRRWIASGSRAVVESTFELTHGWDAALEGQPDSDYGRATSSDFEKYASVYRRWVLNEDGKYSDAPFNAGPAFDLRGLFDDDALVSTPIRVDDCLARDASGQRIGPVVEVSTDSGATWAQYAGKAELLVDHAGLVFEDAVLPSAVLAAAKAGALKVRLTASLTAPLPISATRWHGNSFSGPGPDRRLDWSQAYGYQRVDPDSIHANPIDLGELEADEFDDRIRLSSELARWVIQHPVPQAHGAVDLAGAWTALRIGDRIIDPLASGVAASGQPDSVDRHGLPIRAVRVKYDTDRAAATTHITL